MIRKIIKRIPIRLRVVILTIPIAIYFLCCVVYTCARVFGYFMDVQVMRDAVIVVKACYIASKTGKQVKEEDFYE